MPEFEIYGPRIIRRHLHLSDADMIEPRGLPESSFTARIGGLQCVRTRLLSDAKRFRRKRWYEAFPHPVDERDASDNLIAIWRPIECANSMRGIIKRGKIFGDTRKVYDERTWVLTGYGKPSFCLEWRV